jgi:hypothetical protein
MNPNTIENELYLAVLPMIRMFDSPLPVEEFLTLYPDRNFATNFFPDEVDFFLNLIKRRSGNLTGGHVVRYEFSVEPTEDGRKIIKVIQIVEGAKNA